MQISYFSLEFLSLPKTYQPKKNLGIGILIGFHLNKKRNQIENYFNAVLPPNLTTNFLLKLDYTINNQFGFRLYLGTVIEISESLFWNVCLVFGSNYWIFIAALIAKHPFYNTQTDMRNKNYWPLKLFCLHSHNGNAFKTPDYSSKSLPTIAF